MDADAAAAIDVNGDGVDVEGGAVVGVGAADEYQPGDDGSGGNTSVGAPI